MGDEAPRNIILWYFLALFVVSIILLGWLVRPFISIGVMAAVVTGLFMPVYRFISDKTKFRDTFASLITCVLIFFTLFVPIVLFVTILSSDAYELYKMAKDAVLSNKVRNLLVDSTLIERANLVLSKFNYEITGEQIYTGVSELGKIVGLFLYKQTTAIASNLFNFLVNFFFMLLIIFYLLVDGHRLVSFVVDLSPLPRDQDEKLIQKFKDMAGAILMGNGLCGLIQGLAGGIVFWIFGLNSPFLWGVIMGLLAFLPIIGIGIVFVPAAGILFIKGRIAAGLFFIIFYMVLSGGVEYLLKPKLVGNRVRMHTLIVFISIIGGLKLYGILGIIYGPLIVTAFLTLTDIYRASYQRLVERKEV